MYDIGEVVSLLVDKTEGAGVNSLNVSAGVTGMIVNFGRACGNTFSYIVDFGPEGQWNCRHNELSSLMSRVEDEDVGYNEEENHEEMDNWEELELNNIEEEEASGRYLNESQRPGYLDYRIESAPNPSVSTKKKDNKVISFEEDLARMIAGRK